MGYGAIAGIEAARGRLQTGDDPAFALPGAGGVVEGGEGPHLFGAGLGAAHLEVVGCLSRSHKSCRRAISCRTSTDAFVRR